MTPEESAIVEQLSSLDQVTRQHQLDALTRPHYHDGSWFLESPVVKTWMAEPGKCFLLTGRPGSGKTTLTTQLINFVEENHGNDTGTAIALLYLGTNRPISERPEALFSSLAQQILEKLPSLPVRIRELHATYLPQWSSLPLNIALDVLESALNSVKRTFVFLDGLDEISALHREVLVSNLYHIWDSCPISLFASARPTADIVRLFGQVDSFQQDASTYSSQDIRLFIKDQLQTSMRPEWQTAQGPEAIDLIVTKLTERVDGSFLWARLLTEELLRARTLRDFESRLAGAAPNLHYVYEQMLEKVLLGSKDRSEPCRYALAWLLFAKRQLIKEELQLGITLLSETTTEGHDHINNLDDILDAWNALINWDPQTDRIVLVHVSLRDYLQDNIDKWFPGLQRQIAMCCLAYLSKSDFRTGPSPNDAHFEDRLKTNALYSYAARFCWDHIRTVGSLSKDDMTAIVAFLTHRNQCEAAAQAASVVARASGMSGYSKNYVRNTTGLHIAASHGLVAVVKALLARGMAPAPKDSKGRTPMWLAALKNDREVMSTLGLVDRITLQLVIKLGDHDVTKALLVATSEFLKDYRTRTPLHLAVEYGDADMARLAIANGVDVESQDIDGLTALKLALNKKKIEFVEILLRAGAKTTGITFDDWVKAYNKEGAEIVQISEDQSSIAAAVDIDVEDDSSGKEAEMNTASHDPVNFITRQDLKTSWTRYVQDSDFSKRSICILKDAKMWPASNNPISKSKLGSDYLCYRRPTSDDGQVFRFDVVAAFGRIGGKRKYCWTWTSEGELRTSWTMVEYTSPTGSSSYVTRGYITTVASSCLPEHGSAILRDFFECLQQKWKHVCDEAKSHLHDSRQKVLDPKRLNSQWIHILLEDAQTWIHLRSVLQIHIDKGQEFIKHYGAFGADDPHLSELDRIMGEFSREINKRIDALDESSRSLIEIEFNLTSIAEAFKSTSTNSSMKRLTWITFIFLPLTFVAGLFGMNVNVLSDNPPWWWYLILAGVTMSITILVWTIFKKSNLEHSLENTVFSGLQGSKDTEKATAVAKKDKGS